LERSKMAGEGLVDLARRFVELSDELEDVRDQIKRTVMNGADPAPNPTPAVRPGAKRPHQLKLQAAAEAEQKIIKIVKAQPNLRTMEIAKEMGAKSSTTIERLRRLSKRGLVQGGGAEGWTAP
jgi:hypothetical protein